MNLGIFMLLAPAYLPQYGGLAHCYVPTDVLLLEDPEVSFLGRAMLVFVSDLMFHTELIFVS